ncbi:hypothetical protein DFP97_104313 [Paenibacillus prosopidis]|uniref:Uncharacterized protein n=1 Tax=Paenibacillus prosopidis TaxID=630520 RepID=A0A368W8R4_9BACL|nr:hypothetical protein DFP97_104313 [Paenibacillus prosopidis]
MNHFIYQKIQLLTLTYYIGIKEIILMNKAN